jgi:hypothetical protein
LMVDYCGREIIHMFQMGLKSHVWLHVVLSKINHSWQVLSWTIWLLFNTWQ